MKKDKKIVSNLEIADRVFQTSKREAFITLKDHKPHFMNSPKFRLLNPTKPEIGKISKQIVSKIVTIVREKTCFNQLENTFAAIQWFENLQDTHDLSFIQFDIVDFYPSISEELLSKAIQFARKHAEISVSDCEIIFQARKSFLFHNNIAWEKSKNKEFDVTMGSYDGAEICDLVGLFILSHLQDLGINVALFRDDGLAVSPLDNKQTEQVKQKVKRIINGLNLDITIDANLKCVNFLDVTFNLNNHTYRPYMKPNETPLYIHSQSNHPPSIVKNIGPSVNKRLSAISKSETIFQQSIEPYQKALNMAGHNYELKFDKPNNSVPKRKNRKKKIIWFNPPYSLNVETSIGGNFLKLIDECFPEGHVLHPYINRKTVKVSYRCMPNMKAVIAKQNTKVIRKNLSDNQTNNQTVKKCSHRTQLCPTDGHCNEENIVYQAIVKCDGKEETYTGMTAPPFKFRYANHKSDLKYQKNRGKTALAGHIWDLKDKNADFEIKWGILKKSHAFNPITGKCLLCLNEKFLILFNPEGASLNQRREFFSHCPHKENLTLDKT